MLCVLHTVQYCQGDRTLPNETFLSKNKIYPYPQLPYPLDSELTKKPSTLYNVCCVNATVPYWYTYCTHTFDGGSFLTKFRVNLEPSTLYNVCCINGTVPYWYTYCTHTFCGGSFPLNSGSPRLDRGGRRPDVWVVSWVVCAGLLGPASLTTSDGGVLLEAGESGSQRLHQVLLLV